MKPNKDSNPTEQPSKIFVIVKCIGLCNEKRKIFPGEIKEGDQPMCDKCYMPMVAENAEANL